MGGCCGGHKRTAANTFYDDGDNTEQKSTPKPQRAVSRVSVFYNDGDAVEEESSCSCWGTSSKTKSKKSSKRSSNKGGKKGKRKRKKRRRNKNRRPSSTMSTASTLSRVGHEDTNQNQRTNQVVPEARSFYQGARHRDNERVKNALARKNTMQRAMKEAYDTKSVASSASSEESEDERGSTKKKSTSCFAGLSCKSNNTVASNFHNQ
ncbi:protein FAM133A-like [Lytechinus variegatus]|uniref:protein FAM133A-like n=1 Tax=Lytechinus variegatus TaxID=7654 RepID=UPI001BB0E4B5|nr:protein FAM133A-like [Lytechinus variegatus]XP_041475967.1 protein FAM133A-like [Lytechinus variegatus]